MKPNRRNKRRSPIQNILKLIFSLINLILFGLSIFFRTSFKTCRNSLPYIYKFSHYLLQHLHQFRNRKLRRTSTGRTHLANPPLIKSRDWVFLHLINLKSAVFNTKDANSQKNHSKHSLKRFLMTAITSCLLVINFSGISLWWAAPAIASPTLTIEPLTWDFIGLDSNNVNVGPNNYMVGARICNIGTPGVDDATNLVVKYIKDGGTGSYINLQGVNTVTVPSLPAGPDPESLYGTGTVRAKYKINFTPTNCFDAYYNVVITRNSGAYNTTQQYHIEASANGTGTVRTPANRQLYVEKLLSQARNSVVSFNNLTTGSNTVYVGQTYDFELRGKTATGYPQLALTTDFPNIVFQLLRVRTTYETPAGGVNSAVYGDACGWLADYTLPGYRESSSACAGPIPNQYGSGSDSDAKIGNNVSTIYTIKVLALPTKVGLSSNTVRVNHLIMDFSGGSYHYNADLGTGLGFADITVADAPDLSITKTASGTPFIVGGTGTYNLAITNTTTSTSTTGAITVRDNLPAGMLFQSFTGTNWTCKNALNQPCTAGNAGTLTFTNPGPITGGSTSNISITVKPTVSGSSTNTATVSTPNDSNPNNNQSQVTTTINNAPDLAITKTGPANVTQGQTGAAYILSTQNVGLATTSGTITVTDTLPTGLTPTSASGTGWSCSVSGQSVSCTRSDTFAASATLPDITVLASVPASTTAGLVTNTAVISGGSDPNPNPSLQDPNNNNRSDLAINIGSSPDLKITKTHTGTFAQGSSGNSFTLSMGNIGNGATSGTITVTDILPNGLTPGTATGTGWTCSTSSQTVTCTRNDTFAAGTASTPTALPSITIPVSVTAIAASFTNNASVYVPLDGNSTNNTATDTVQTPPDITVSKVAKGTFIKSTGQGTATVAYEIKVKNIGGSATTGQIIVNDEIVDNAVTFQSFDSTNSTSGWTCTGGDNSATTGVTEDFTCTNQVGTTITNLAAIGQAADTATLTINVTLANNVGNSVQNNVNVSGGGESNTSNNSATITTPTTNAAKPDLIISKTHTGNFTQGQTGATYTVTVKNAGSATTSGQITVTDTIPTGLTATAASGSNWSCSVTGSGTGVTCTSITSPTAFTLAANTTSNITVTVNVASNAPSSVTNQVSVSGGSDSDTNNNTATDPTTIIAPTTPDLKITKTGPTSLKQGDTNSYILSVQNIGQAATNTSTIYVTDSVPSPLVPTDASGTGWTCSISGQNVSCNRNNSLASTASYPDITIKVSVPANATGSSLTNTAQVSGSSSSLTAAGGETNTGNNTGSVTNINITSAPDLTISKGDNGPFTQGGTGTYTLTVTNSGAAASSGTITVTDTLPTGITPNFTSPTTYNGWSCSISSQTITCTNSSLTLPASGGNSSMSLPIKVAVDAPASVTNKVRIDGGNEVNTSNNTATKTTTINSVPDLITVKSHTGNFTQGQTGAIYTLRVVNIGSAATDGTQIKITDTLPTGLTATSASGTGWNCTISADKLTVTCDRTDVLAGNYIAYPDITLTVNVAANASSPLVNQATVSGATVGSKAGGENNTTNNSATDSTTIDPFPTSPDLTITKSHTGTFDQGQVGATYTLTVKNIGTAASSGVVTVTDYIPPDLTPTNASGTGWNCSISGQTVTCTRSDALAINASYPNITLTVNVANNSRGEILNQANVSNANDTNTSNNYASDPTDVNQKIDLSIAKIPPATLTQGQVGAVYTITVKNVGVGPSDGSTVTVTDTLPAELTATEAIGTGWTCNLSNLNKTVTCTRSDVLNGNNAAYPSINLKVDVSSTATYAINYAHVGGGGDVNTANNDVTVSTPVNPASNTGTPNIRLVKRITKINATDITGFVDDSTNTDDNAAKWPTPTSTYLRGAINGLSVKPKDEIEYTIYFLSDGTADATNLTICDLIPANTTFIPNAFNGTTLTDGGNPTADLGIAIALNSTTLPTTPTAYLTNVKDLPDRGQFYAAGATVPSACTSSNTNGAVIVDVVTKPTTLPKSTAAGTPTNSYGFVRFKVKVN